MTNKEVINILLKSWNRVPELRLGQLITCVFKDKDIFYITDEDFIKEIEQWIKKDTNVP